MRPLPLDDLPAAEGFRLRLLREDDLEDLVTACQDPEIPRWTMVPSPYGIEQARAFLTVSREEHASGAGLHTIIADADSDRVLGSVGFPVLRRAEGYGEMGWWLAAHARGRGVMARAIAALAGWAGPVLGLREIEALIVVENVASRRAAERAGFVATGDSRACVRGGCAVEGRPPHLVYRFPISAA